MNNIRYGGVLVDARDSRRILPPPQLLMNRLSVDVQLALAEADRGLPISTLEHQEGRACTCVMTRGGLYKSLSTT